jgi:hypothetical protein
MRHDISKCKLKRDIIAAIKRLAPDRYSDRQLQRMKKTELKLKLTEVFEEKCKECLVGPEEPQQTDESPERRHDSRLVIECMYQCILGVCTITEGLSKKYSCYLGGMCLHNYRQNIDNSDFSRETLKTICHEVFLEHKETLTNLMSKEGRLIVVLLLSGIQSVRKYSPMLENGHVHRNSRQNIAPVEQNDLRCRRAQYQDTHPDGKDESRSSPALDEKRAREIMRSGLAFRQ